MAGSSTMLPVRKVIIIGGGPAGLSAALLLKRRNRISPIIYELRPEPTTMGGAIMVTCNGLRLLDRLGLYNQIAQVAPENSHMMARSSNGSELGRLELGTWSAAQTGFKSRRVRRTDLQRILLDAVREENIPIHYGKQLSAVVEEDPGVSVSFADGTADRGDLLLGCDGTHSAVRSLYVDPLVMPEYTGLSTVYSFVSASSLSESARIPDRLTATFTPYGMFALMPANNSNDSASTSPSSEDAGSSATKRDTPLFWFFQYEVPVPSAGDTQDGWQEQATREQDGFKGKLLDSILRDVSGSWGELLRGVVRATAAVKFYPIFALPPDTRWSRGRALLLGDAAHAMPPHTGQGVSMALEDVFLLSRLLLLRREQQEAEDSSEHSDQQQQQQLEDLFAKFEEVRRPRLKMFLKYGAKRGEVRKAAGPWKHWARETMMAAALRTVNLLQLAKWGFGEGTLVYDIDEAPIDQ